MRHRSSKQQRATHKPTHKNACLQLHANGSLLLLLLLGRRAPRLLVWRLVLPPLLLVLPPLLVLLWQWLWRAGHAL
jgi:hypothetical protein